MITFKQFLIEYNAPSQFGVITSDLISPVISGQGGGADVTVMNPKGVAFNNATKPTLGMGFEMAPNLTGQLQKFVNKYSYKNTNSVNKVIDSKNPVTWQTTNQAVSNQQKEELNKLLVKFNLTPNEPNAPPPMTKPPPPVPDGGVPQRGQYPASSEETAEQFQARWEEYMRLLRLNQQWQREKRERLIREREERQRELDRQQRERDRNPNGQSLNFVQDPDFVGPPAPMEEPEIFGPPDPGDNPAHDFNPDDDRFFDQWWDQTLEEKFRQRWEKEFGNGNEKALQDALKRMREYLWGQWHKWHRTGGNNRLPAWLMMRDIFRDINDYFDNPPIYA